MPKKKTKAPARKKKIIRKEPEPTPVVTEVLETRLLVRFGFELAREVGIGKVLVLAELVGDRRTVESQRESETLIWIVEEEPEESGESYEHFVMVPAYASDRISRLTMGLIVAVMQGVVDVEESVVCLTGVAGSKRLDNLLIANPGRDFAWFARHGLDGKMPSVANLREFIQLLGIALQFAAEGREGKPVGTIFVLGEVEQLQPYLRPLILNPLKGHIRRRRSIHDPAFIETVRELAALDGAFIVDPRGVIERAGTYINAPADAKNVRVGKGLGARHMGAASITAVADCLAIAISESSGRVTIYSQGEEVLALERGV